MTGFARVRRTMPAAEMILSLKSVNHRGLDLNFHLSPDFDRFENGIRNVIKRHVIRGHIDVRISFTRTREAQAASLNRPLLAAWFSAFQVASDELGIQSRPDLNSAFRLPGMFSEPVSEEFTAELETEITAAAEEAAQSLNAFRSREGAEIAAEMLGHNRRIQDAAGRIDEIRAGATLALQARLTDRLGELLRGAGIDPQRLAQEVAILADRSDIGEEIARLKIHANQVAEVLKGGGEVGKRLDFLLQEMNRESNTILSKTSGIGELGLGITDLALTCKSSIEKIREQALNLE